MQGRLALGSPSAATIAGASGSAPASEGGGGKGTGLTFSRPREQPIVAPALRNRGFLKAASDQMIKATLMNGREGTPMPSFLDKGLTEQDINDLVAYVRNFENRLPPKQDDAPPERPIKVMQSPYGLGETVEALKRAAIGRNFRVIRTQYFEGGSSQRIRWIRTRSWFVSATSAC